MGPEAYEYGADRLRGMIMVRAIGVFSGGLDSILAVEAIRRQGIEVLAVTFETPFFGGLRARASAERLGVPHRVVDITREYIQILLEPKFGYGRHMNPCMDCHALMLRKAGEILDAERYDFIFSGEVLGQRPFSQNRRALEKVARYSGRQELICRPLSARCLPPSGPEKKGWVDRDLLLDIRGRSRKPQMDLARQWGIDAYPSPAGGCRLTDPAFSRRLADLLRNEPQWNHRDLRLLSVGRHLRILPDRKVIAGRNQKENEAIEAMAAPTDILLTPFARPGPTVLIPHGGPPALVEQASSACLRYAGLSPQEVDRVRAVQVDREWIVVARAAAPSQTDSWLI